MPPLAERSPGITPQVIDARPLPLQASRPWKSHSIPERPQLLRTSDSASGRPAGAHPHEPVDSPCPLLTAPFMVVLDFFIVNVAIPSLSLDLHAGSTVIEWVVAGYGLTTAIGLVAAGRLGDRIGRRRVFWAGMLLFTVASAACGLAPSGARSWARGSRRASAPPSSPLRCSRSSA